MNSIETKNINIAYGNVNIVELWKERSFKKYKFRNTKRKDNYNHRSKWVW